MLSSKPLSSLLNNRQLDTTAFGKRNPRLSPFANDEDITHASCKLMTSCILNMDGLKAPLVLLPALDHAHSPSVPSPRNHNHIPHIEFYEISDLVAFQVQFYGVISLDYWVRIADGAPVVGVQIRDALLSKLNRPNLTQLKLSKGKKKKV